MAEPKIKQLHQTLEENLFLLNALEDELKDREKLQQEEPWFSKNNAWKVEHTKELIANVEMFVADILDRISAENKKNMNLAFTIGNKHQGKSFGVGVPGGPGAVHLRNHIAQFLGGKRRKTRRKTRRRKTKKEKKNTTPKKTKKDNNSGLS